ncbi:MAG TPA: thioredoxin family protein, partial [Pirellula sp.]|nr:thioredoxin family protein [Pirellula sp.]
VELSVGSQTIGEPANAVLSAVPFKEIVENPTLTQWVDVPKIKLTLSPMEILAKFCLAMLGGLILNFMPCVLPVIGLKVLGFVSEAGGDRKIASMLTLTYAAGITSLILGLGLFSVAVRSYTGEAFGWGEQFGSVYFRILITAFMFSLALSFLGVWEIPIPGFAMSKISTELSNKEGYQGAFYKGLITTLLATPCSAPLLGGVFVVALSQPAWVVLLIFGGVGLGMSLPYLAVAAQPSMLSFLPKPGPWMETFKEVLAFPMLLSVVYFVSGFPDEERIAMLSALMFVWFGCWMVGRVPAWSEANVKTRNWSIAAIVAFLGTWGSFYVLQPSHYQLAWQEYNEAKLDALVAEGKTVMIDFTANWCPTCITNLATAIETKHVKEIVESDHIVPMIADFTKYPPALKAKLGELNSISIPVLAIYSGMDQEHPIILRDVITESQLIEALKTAGPSKSKESLPTSTGAVSNTQVQ